MTRAIAGASAVTFLLHARDKTAAEGGHRRTPEATLNAFAVRGGWPGAWVAQQAFRHKYRKQWDGPLPNPTASSARLEVCNHQSRNEEGSS